MLVHCWQEGTMVQSVWKTLRQFLKKLNIELPHDPQIPLLGIYPKEPKTGSQRGICAPVFIKALFTTVKRYKEPKCTSMDKWINKKMQYIHTVEYYLAFNREEILTNDAKWLNLEKIILGEISQSQKDKYCMISLIWDI